MVPQPLAKADVLDVKMNNDVEMTDELELDRTKSDGSYDSM